MRSLDLSSYFVRSRARSRASTLLSVLCLVVLSSSAAHAGGRGQWQWLEEKRGIQLWALEVPGQSLPGFRGNTKIKGSIAQIASEMLDAPHHTEWMHRCAESWVYQRTSETRGVLYNRTSSAPWPVWDRDVVLDVQFDYAPDQKALTVRFKNLDNLLRPVPERVVRMPKLAGFYKMVQVEPNLTNVTYQVEVDVGGSIPDWIAEEVAKDLPYYTLLSLRERVEGIAEEVPALPVVPAVAVELPPKHAQDLQAANN
ncbi:MAG: START domain-containing protein [Myxococcales bacterium]